jgi:hypothetical protein
MDFWIDVSSNPTIHHSFALISAGILRIGGGNVKGEEAW